MSFREQLITMPACDEAIEWVGGRTLAEAWSVCPRGDWMLWGLAKMIGQPGWPSHQEVVRHTCWCVQRVLKYIRADNTIPRQTMKIAYSWIGGEIAIADVRQRARDAGIIWSKDYLYSEGGTMMISVERLMSLHIIELIIRTGKTAASANAFKVAKLASVIPLIAQNPLITQKKMAGTACPVFTGFLLRRPEPNGVWMQELTAQADYLRSQIVIPSTTG